MEYFVLKSSAKGGFAGLEYLENVKNSYEVDKGNKLLDTWSTDASFSMNREHPNQTLIPDSFSNLDGMNVISEKCKIRISDLISKDIEFLPVKIFDHNNAQLQDTFFILNPLKVVDCIDQEQSKIKWNNIDPDKISSCLRLVLKEETLEHAPPIFRIKHMSEVILVSEEIADKLEDSELKGLRLVEIDEF